MLEIVFFIVVLTSLLVVNPILVKTVFLCFSLLCRARTFAGERQRASEKSSPGGMQSLLFSSQDFGLM